MLPYFLRLVPAAILVVGLFFMVGKLATLVVVAAGAIALWLGWQCAAILLLIAALTTLALGLIKATSVPLLLAVAVLAVMAKVKKNEK